MDREEALKIVRENYPHFGTTEPWLDLEKALATLIPELRESEDERIRKALVSLVEELQRSDKYFSGVALADMLAWLEKQKELPTDEEMLRTLCCEYEKGVADTIAKYEQQEQKPAVPVLSCSAAWFEDGEQKPIFRVGDTMRTWDEAKRGIKDGLPHIISINSTDYLCNNEKIRISEQGDYEFPPMNRQKPAEWSEEDREMIDHLIEALPMWANGRIAMLPSQADEYVERLKSLCPQPKQEWSEEDEQLLGFIYDLIADSLWNSKYAMSRDECLDRLTSLRQHLQPRPSWKPSEEDEEPLSIF